MPETILFIHIPKTAGTAFSNYLHDTVADPARSMAQFYGDYSIYDGFCDLKLISGHVLFREMASRFPDARFVTWLRHPIERVASQYKSWHNPANVHPHWEANVGPEGAEHLRLTQQMTFEEFVFSENHAIISSIINVQTAYLSSWRNGHFRFLTSAKQNLVRRFPFFGIVERFSESIALFRSTFRWETEFRNDSRTANRSGREETPLNSRIVDRILEMNALDMELYRFGCLLFEDRLRLLNESSCARERAEPTGSFSG